ncbi:cytochrome C oxidase Cbb3 [Flavobacterium sp. Sd200]|uniref:FixH family protein n=1 Tax=Flavobacterium sp. Sd200 TaxID=2692211 RepID=UPI00137055C5|nr:FixH family protein [Flavobacterium sp. Sd200]MXN90103.1 cytochrome C oxidase Cbb3 [Flavobacterium sp. Sd200]
MKINWGTGIAIAIVCFMGFILFFVFSVQANHKYDNELVVEEYYKQERVLQTKIDKEENAAALSAHVAVEVIAEGIKIDFPKGFDYKNIKGKVSLYRPSSRELDFEVPISLSAPYMLIPTNALAGGRWDISIDWNYNGTGYLNTEKLTLK